VDPIEKNHLRGMQFPDITHQARTVTVTCALPRDPSGLETILIAVTSSGATLCLVVLCAWILRRR